MPVTFPCRRATRPVAARLEEKRTSPGGLAAITTSVLHTVVAGTPERREVDASRSREQSLLVRQSALQGEAREVISELGLHTVFASYNPVLITGSFVSGLMVWRDLDVMLLGGPRLSPADVLTAITGLVMVPGLVGFEYADERGSRCPTGESRDERYHVPMTYVRASGTWRLDLTFWLHDPHENITAWHEQLRDSLTPQQRMDILAIKDAWHRRPEYPKAVSGFEIYTAVLDHGVRTPRQFEIWLAAKRTVRS